MCVYIYIYIVYFKRLIISYRNRSPCCGAHGNANSSVHRHGNCHRDRHKRSANTCYYCCYYYYYYYDYYAGK